MLQDRLLRRYRAWAYNPGHGHPESDPARPGSLSPLAPRPADLRGKRIGILDNSKPNADALLGRVAELLLERAGAAEIRRWRKPGASTPAADHDALATGADVFLTGSAD